ADALLLVEVANSLLTTGVTHSLPPRGIIDQRPDGVGKPLRIPRRDKDSSDAVVHDLATAAKVGCDHREPPRGRPHCRAWKALAVRSEDVEIHSSVQTNDIVACPDEPDTGRQRRGAIFGSQGLRFGRIGGTDHHKPSSRKFVTHSPGGLEE